MSHRNNPHKRLMVKTFVKYLHESRLPWKRIDRTGRHAVLYIRGRTEQGKTPVVGKVVIRIHSNGIHDQLSLMGNLYSASHIEQLQLPIETGSVTEQSFDRLTITMLNNLAKQSKMVVDAINKLESDMGQVLPEDQIDSMNRFDIEE